MEKFKKFIKEMRFEYKVLSIVIILLLLSIPYSIIKKKFFPDNNIVQLSNSGIGNGSGSNTAGVASTSLTDMQNNAASSDANGGSSPSSISEAVNADRPLIIDETAITNQNTSQLQQLMAEIPDIKHIELATQVENPTVWIYSLNDGLRKDEEALNYCILLHAKGIPASNVTIYDERARRSGKLIELGTASCM